MASEVDEIGAGEDPFLEIGDVDDEAGGVHKGMGALDDHIARGVDVDAGSVARVDVHEPDDDGDVVGHALKRHRDGAVDLEEVDGAPVVVGERRRLGLQGRVGGDEGDEVLPDEPFDVLGVREGGGAALREDAAQEGGQLLLRLRG